MKRRTQRRRRAPKTRRVRKGLVFMGGQGHNAIRNEINALTNRAEFLKSIGLSLAEYNRLSQVQQDYIDSMYNKANLSNNEKKGMQDYYKTYMSKSNEGKREENAVYNYP